MSDFFATTPWWARPMSENELRAEHDDYEFNARYDYLAELRAEHDDSAACEYEAQLDREACHIEQQDEIEARGPTVSERRSIWLSDLECPF